MFNYIHLCVVPFYYSGSLLKQQLLFATEAGNINASKGTKLTAWTKILKSNPKYSLHVISSFVWTVTCAHVCKRIAKRKKKTDEGSAKRVFAQVDTHYFVTNVALARVTTYVPPFVSLIFSHGTQNTRCNHLCSYYPCYIHLLCFPCKTLSSFFHRVH